MQYTTPTARQSTYRFILQFRLHLVLGDALDIDCHHNRILGLIPLMSGLLWCRGSHRADSIFLLFCHGGGHACALLSGFLPRLDHYVCRLPSLEIFQLSLQFLFCRNLSTRWIFHNRHRGFFIAFPEFPQLTANLGHPDRQLGGISILFGRRTRHGRLHTLRSILNALIGSHGLDQFEHEFGIPVPLKLE